MSGPKIIDVAATREAERLRLNSLIARIEVATRHFHKLQATSHQAHLDHTLVTQIQEKMAAATTVYELLELRGLAQQQLDFIKTERTRLRQTQLEHQARHHSAAKTLDAAIHSRLQSETNPEIRAKLQTALALTDLHQKSQLYENALSETANQTTCAATDATLQAINDWLASETIPVLGSQPDTLAQIIPPWRLEIERIRAELAILPASSPALQERVESSLQQIESENDPPRRRLLLDHLRYSLADDLRQLREASQRTAQIEEWRAALAQHSQWLDLPAWENRLTSDPDLTEKEIETALETATAQAAAQAARRTVLQSLQSLGYELRPGMESGFIVDGKIVIKKPHELDYGVELTTLPQGPPSLVRARVVRLHGPEASTAEELLRDREQEESWCRDRESMESFLRSQGIECELKASRPAGQTPVTVSALAPDPPQIKATDLRPQMRSDRSKR